MHTRAHTHTHYYTYSVFYTALKHPLLCWNVKFSCIQTNGAFVSRIFSLEFEKKTWKRKEKRKTHSRAFTIDSLEDIMCVKYVRHFACLLCSAAPYLHLCWLNLIDIFRLIFYGRLLLFTYSILSDAINFFSLLFFDCLPTCLSLWIFFSSIFSLFFSWKPILSEIGWRFGRLSM